MNIIDTPYNTESRISCLLSKGVKTVIRYYNFSNSRTFPQKCLTLAEAEALSADGLQIAVVFQQRQNQIADFSLVKGVAAGRRAYQLAQNNIGQPAGSAIYFSVDFDADEEQIRDSITPYFQGIQEAFTEASRGTTIYEVGAYGSGLVCNKLLSVGLISKMWLSMSLGFRGTREAIKKGNYHLVQHAPASTLCGIGVDFNDSNPLNPDFGAFTIAEEIVDIAFEPALHAKYKVIARNGLRLREGPGTQFDVIGSLKPGQMIFAPLTIDGWARVDVEGDGQIDGFASIDFLQKI